MSTHPTAFCVAQVVGLSGAAFLSGKIFSLSTVVVPAIIQATREDQLPVTTAAKIWRNLYTRGKAQAPPIAAVTSAAFLYCAWAVRSSPSLAPWTPRNSSSMYCTAAALTLGIVPYTFGFMAGTNDKLMDKAGSKADEKSGVEVEALLSWWLKLNAGRALLPLVAGLVGLVAATPWPLEMI
ncbi:hypothetical protein BDV28DRAFT_25113 [Aspergillus coremiiformis]|uniref:DUF1772-domain-containing protein n=1 Tax=Aspergillus coremiiformis TaxID=138285 RepID=A0A5N6Z0D7_9EURO|nr:hypothetical protein BDV28DRAFT_25113 [Aspergillus coremiiformis]